MVYETVQLLGRLGRSGGVRGWCYVSKSLDERADWSDRELALCGCLASIREPCWLSGLVCSIYRPPINHSPLWPVHIGCLMGGGGWEHSGADLEPQRSPPRSGWISPTSKGRTARQLVTQHFQRDGGRIGSDRLRPRRLDRLVHSSPRPCLCSILFCSRSGSIVCTGTSTENAGGGTSRIPPA